MNEKTKYLVAKETYSYRFCITCAGSGVTTRTFQGRKFTGSCNTCRGTGKEKFTARTEIDLQTALNEIAKSLKK